MIAKSLNQQISYSDIVISPFLIPLSLPLIVDSTTIKIPLISFDYIVPEMNLAFTAFEPEVEIGNLFSYYEYAKEESINELKKLASNTNVSDSGKYMVKKILLI